jgi:hypothetical protein
MSHLRTPLQDTPLSAPDSSPGLQQRELILAAERKVYSQFNEDGILLWLFDRLGEGHRRFVEFGIENGKECNTANLSLHHGWSGTLLEGDPAQAARARQFYGSGPAAGRVTVTESFVTAENINAGLAAHAEQGPTDLLSIDIDGNDLFVWRAISVIRPRVVVIEYNVAFGPHRSLSVRYDPQFERFRYHASGIYHGASLAAMTAVGREKGYALVGCESHGVNAFFVYRSLLERSGLVELTPAEAYYEHAWRAKRFGSSQEQFAMIQHLDLTPIFCPR